uniref:ABC transmembrane type-1 domain-containing protein n=1 Tax=Chryseobacterium sp. B5 TaxID=2050562 RepID=A0A2G7T6C5_9FLAO
MSTSLERWMVSRSRVQLAATVACGCWPRPCWWCTRCGLARLLAQAMEGASLHPWLAIGLAALVLRGVLVWLEEWWAQQVGMRTRAVLRERLLARLMRLGPAWAAARPTGELQATLVAAVDAVQVHASRHVPSLLGAVLGCALALGALAWVDAGCALLLAVFVLGQPLLDRLWLRRHMPGGQRRHGGPGCLWGAAAGQPARHGDPLGLWRLGALAHASGRTGRPPACRVHAHAARHLVAHRPDAFRWPGRHGQCPGVGQLATGPGPAGCGIAAGRAAAVA